MTILFISGGNSVSGQPVTDFHISANSGYATNPYMIPMISEWDRGLGGAYAFLSPSMQMRWGGYKQNLAINTSAYLHQITEGNQTWTGGFLSADYRRNITSSLNARVTGGLNYHETSYQRSLQWVQVGAEWSASHFTRFDLNLGPIRQHFSNHNDADDFSSRYDAYRIGAEYWPGYRWRLKTEFTSSLSHITNPGESFSLSASVTRFLSGGYTLILQSGLEQYTHEFEFFPENGTGTSVPQSQMMLQQIPDTPDEEIVYTMEDRFHRTSLTVYRPVGNRLTITGRISGLLWFSSEDSAIESDFQFSAGLQIPFSLRRSQSGPVQSLDWKSTEPGETVLTLRYSGDDPLYITGDFNNWDTPGIPMQKTGRNRYRVDLDLSAGMYEFKIAIRDNDQVEWMELPDDTPTTDDGFGGQNGNVFVDY